LGGRLAYRGQLAGPSGGLRKALSNAGADPVGSTPAQYTAFVQSEYAKWAKVIKAAGFKGE